MFCIKQAKELCIEAHNGQWRRPFNNVKCHADIPEHIGRKLINGTISSYILKKEDNIGQELYVKITYTGLFELSYPYHTHPFEVSDMMDTDEEKITGYLHDIVEDTNYGIAAFIEDYSKENIYAIILRDKNYYISENIYNALKLLRKRKNQPYQEYIESISENKLAAKVKIADITCNLLDNPSENQKKKYRRAMKTLLKEF